MQAIAKGDQITEIEARLRDDYEARLDASVEEVNRLVHRQLELLAAADDLEARLMATRKTLEEVRAENAALKQYDPLRMKKNLAANKKKLAAKQEENESLRKKLTDSHKANAKLLQRLARLSVIVRNLGSAGGAVQRR